MLQELTVVTTKYNYDENNFPESNQLFGVDSKKAWECINGEHFPEKSWGRENQITDLSLVCLLYLASIKDNPEKSPFTVNQKTIVENSHFWNKVTIGSIIIFGYVINPLIAVTASYLALIPSKNSTNVGNENQQVTLSPYALVTIIAVFGILINVFATWATGSAPDKSSNAFNAKQDALQGMEKVYEDLAKRLIYFYGKESQDEARKIASKIDINYLKKHISKKIKDRPRGERILEHLRDAVEYINSNGAHLPKENFSLRLFIEMQHK